MAEGLRPVVSLSRIVAEYLVARALGVADGVRKEWDTHDVTTPTGVRVEVKSAAYVQTWAQRQESTIVFGIAPTRAWDEATGKYHDESRRQADVYVFALLAEKDKTLVNPLAHVEARWALCPEDLPVHQLAQALTGGDALPRAAEAVAKAGAGSVFQPRRNDHCSACVRPAPSSTRCAL